MPSSTSNVISPMSSPTSTVSSTTFGQSDSHHNASGIVRSVRLYAVIKHVLIFYASIIVTC